MMMCIWKLVSVLVGRTGGGERVALLPRVGIRGVTTFGGARTSMTSTLSSPVSQSICKKEVYFVTNLFNLL